jgi:hypothetical protein
MRPHRMSVIGAAARQHSQIASIRPDRTDIVVGGVRLAGEDDASAVR